MNQGTERVVSRTVAVVVAAFAGFLVLGTVFDGAWWVGRMYLVAWALLPFFLVAMGLVVYFERNVLTDDGPSSPKPTPDPGAVLRERYARGEIDEAELERRTERLLETGDDDALAPLGVETDGSEGEATRR